MSRHGKNFAKTHEGKQEQVDRELITCGCGHRVIKQKLTFKVDQKQRVKKSVEKEKKIQFGKPFVYSFPL